MAIQTGVNVSNLVGFAVQKPPEGVLLANLVGFAVLRNVNLTPPYWGSWAFTSGVLGVAYDQSFDMPDAASPTNYSLVSGALPDGLSVDDVSGNVGHIHGTPTKADTFTFTLRAANSAGSAEKEFTITIIAAGGGAHCFAWIG